MARPHQLSDHEARFLSILLSTQPATTHQVSKAYRDSPVLLSTASKGTIYPLMRRLADQGLITRLPVPGDGRGTELLELTTVGARLLRKWIMDVSGIHLLQEDPLREKASLFALLGRHDRQEWLSEAKSLLRDKMAELRGSRKPPRFSKLDAIVEEAMISSVRCRLDWIVELEKAVLSGVEEFPAAMAAG